jgi:hypothetical protein
MQLFRNPLAAKNSKSRNPKSQINPKISNDKISNQTTKPRLRRGTDCHPVGSSGMGDPPMQTAQRAAGSSGMGDPPVRRDAVAPSEISKFRDHGIYLGFGDLEF